MAKNMNEASGDSHSYHQRIIDALSANIAVIDDKGGVILTFNAAWRNFAQQNNLGWHDYGIGHSYPEICSFVSVKIGKQRQQS